MMRLTRRHVMQGGAAALPGLALPGVLRGQARAAQVSLLLDGIGPGTDPDRLESTVATFLSAGLPVTCVADLVALTALEAGGRQLCDLLARLALRDPGLFDLALPIGKLPRTERYFQLRRAGQLREAVVRAFRDGPAGDRAFPVVTLIDRGEDPNIDHTAFRGAGFRIHLRAADGPVSMVVAGRGELVGTGGLWTALDAPGLPTRLAQALSGGGDLLLSLSLEGAADPVARASEVAALLAASNAAGRIHMASPAQLRLYQGRPLPIDLALLVEAGTTLEEDDAILAFVRELAGQGVPLTLTGQAETYGELPGTVLFCAPAAASPTLPPPACQRDGDLPAPGGADPVAVHVGSAPAVWPVQGIDPDGRLRLTPRQLSAPGLDGVLDLSPLEDHVILIRPEDVAQPVRRTQIVQRLVDAALSGEAYFHTIPGLAAHLVETEPVLARLWSVRRRKVTDPLRPPSPDAAARSGLLADARLAWTYIERFTDARTGMCAGTVRGGSMMVINREATLWDLASQLHGIRAAHELGLIGRDDARDRIRLLVANLPIGEVEGARLPPAMFRTDTGSVVAPGFDVCDAGRFLIALDHVVEAGLLDRTAAEAVVAGWDLAVALPEGRPRSHLQGRWIDTTQSHCTPYSRRGMAAWGFTLVSPYPGLAGGTQSDRDIAFLYDVAAIGQVGIEPVLLEIIELGADRDSALIAEVLFDAQLDWWETTGQFKCASEAPLNFPPWFSYQGLRLGHLGDAAWVVRGLGGAAQYDTPEFRAKAELLSTKSAYLWGAVRAHDWCDRLLEVMRDRTRIEGLGFSVGVFTRTMEAMRDYTDLNTNGVILTAIGHALRHA
ncbi:DUF3131 domain-containing protein [Tabrizicola caldifontis]|uniref:DUF3131 domain-containing protein n=1 Tax=Tabrizicola caldifontis TaxID=2528036 RepID=UPI0010812331|nr:DUF3131 domain-containing protein [Rhodobacter sp. YIM 73028]